MRRSTKRRSDGVGVVYRQVDQHLRVLAELTGGIAVVNQNDYEKSLKRIDAETTTTTCRLLFLDPDPMRRTRRVEVKVKRKDLDVWSRQTYSLKDRAPKVVPRQE